MPITLPPITRRQFLGQSAALAAVAGLPRLGFAAQDDAPDPHRVVLFSDTHIDQNPAATGGQDRINMNDYFNRCIDSSLRGPLPAQALVCGDCAYGVGRVGDYERFLTLTVKLLERGVPVHCALGNHDNLANFFEAGVAAEPDDPPVQAKHVGVVETARAHWLLLDSLKETGIVSGELGETQQRWLSETLDALDDRPVMVMVHHNFDWEQRDGSDWGLHDAEPMFATLSEHSKVKAVFYGHSHKWEHSQRDDGIHLVNLPPTSYVFERGRPFGWIDCALREDHARLRLECVDRRHQQHGERVELTYR